MHRTIIEPKTSFYNMHDEGNALLVVGVDNSVEVLKWEMIPQWVPEGMVPQNGVKRRKKANAGAATAICQNAENVPIALAILVRLRHYYWYIIAIRFRRWPYFADGEDTCGVGNGSGEQLGRNSHSRCRSYCK